MLEKHGFTLFICGIISLYMAIRTNVIIVLRIDALGNPVMGKAYPIIFLSLIFSILCFTGLAFMIRSYFKKNNISLGKKNHIIKNLDI